MTALAGKVAVVTGVTSGIGEAVATRLLAEGVTVAGLGRSPERLTTAVRRFGPRFLPICADLSARDERRRALLRLREDFPRIDVIVNNAGETVFETVLELDADRFADLVEVNLLAAVEVVQRLAGALPADGHVVNVSSVTARHVAHARFTPYALTKTALERFTEGLRLELAPRGIKVSLVVPGLVDTPIYDKVAGFDAARGALQKQVPTWLSAGDVADAVLWMLTRPASVVASELVLLPRHQAR